MRNARLVLTTAGIVIAFAGCEALEYKNVGALGWTIWVLVAFSVFGAISAIARFIWKRFHGQPTGRPVSAHWGIGGWRLWWWLGGTESISEDSGGDWSGGNGGSGD